MIPIGYIDSVYAWAKRPDLSDDERQTRQTQLLDLHDALVTGQLVAKPSRVLTSGTLNGKTFTWAPGILAEEKMTVLTAVLGRLGLLAPGSSSGSSVIYANFSEIQR